jgi:hydroxymethylpyrimidine/phosphomethylpyrimidine kinase
VALTFAGSDPSGGAGLQADLRAFAAHGVDGACAVTAVTVQDSGGLWAVHPVPAEVVLDQARAVAAAAPLAAIKTGMLATAATVAALAAWLRDLDAPALVVDPVLSAHAGGRLLEEAGVEVLRAELMPLADIVTPNLPEAARLLAADPGEASTWSRARREEAARALADLACGAVLLKGGHAADAASMRAVADVLVDAGRVQWLESPRIDTDDRHGTGCTLASAIAAGLARGWSLEDSVRSARTFVLEALRAARAFGGGRGGPDALHRLTPIRSPLHVPR